MSKITLAFSYTFKIGDQKHNQYSKINLEISEIDTELPLKPQLDESMNVTDEVWKLIKQKVDTIAEGVARENQP